MSQVLSTIGDAIGSKGGQTLLGLGTAGAGLTQNIIANREAEQKQKLVRDFINNPAKFSAAVSAAEKPLSQGLTSDIARQTDAYGAERGLGSSPAVMRDVYAQALAPYEQNEQQMAINSVLQRLGIYADTPTTKPVDMSSVFKLLSLGGGGKGGGGLPGVDLPNIQSPGITPDYIPNLPSPVVDTGTMGDIPGLVG